MPLLINKRNVQPHYIERFEVTIVTLKATHSRCTIYSNITSRLFHKIFEMVIHICMLILHYTVLHKTVFDVISIFRYADSH